MPRLGSRCFEIQTGEGETIPEFARGRIQWVKPGVKHSRNLQVKRIFHDVILASPLIQHKIGLFAAGLEYNAAAGVDLTESRKAFLQYTSSLDSLRPIEERVVGEVQADGFYRWSAAGGVHAVFTDSVRLLSLGSASRGIPYKEWKIPSPINDAVNHCIHPGANIIAFVEMNIRRYVHSHSNRFRKLIPMQR